MHTHKDIIYAYLCSGMRAVTDGNEGMRWNGRKGPVGKSEQRGMHIHKDAVHAYLSVGKE